jgi:hypothetical protein
MLQDVVMNRAACCAEVIALGGALAMAVKVLQLSDCSAQALFLERRDFRGSGGVGKQKGGK